MTSTVTLGPRLPVRWAANLECALDRVSTGHRRHASRHCQSGPPVVTNIDDPSPQVQLDGNTKRIEAATQVGDRARDHDLCPRQRRQRE